MSATDHAVDLVIKFGGGLLAHPDEFRDALACIALTAERRRLVVVPGGGPFADTVREINQHINLGDDEAHWMALLAMDQYAHVLATRLEGGLLVQGKDSVAAAIDAGRVPVLAPYRWLRDADPLPHSWDITSDSISAWIAGEFDAGQLVLIKPPDAEEPFCDAYFKFALPPRVPSMAVRAGQPLRTALAAC